MFASRRDSIEDDVRERFVRVVGLPEAGPWDTPPVVPAPPVPGPVPPTGAGPGGVVEGGGLPAGGAWLRRGLPAVFGGLDPGRRGVRALALVAVLAVAVAGFYAWRSRPHVEPVAAARTEAPAVASPSPAGVVVVAVTGRVQRPGLIHLPAGSRVADAIAACGGVQPGTDLSYVNLARKLVDGELVAVGITPPPEAAAGTPGGGPGGGAVNLNTATAAQFETLPGIGPVLAQHIVDYRTQHGQFRSVDELRQVTGLGASRFDQIKPLVTV